MSLEVKNDTFKIEPEEAIMGFPVLLKITYGPDIFVVSTEQLVSLRNLINQFLEEYSQEGIKDE